MKRRMPPTPPKKKIHDLFQSGTPVPKPSCRVWKAKYDRPPIPPRLLVLEHLIQTPSAAFLLLLVEANIKLALQNVLNGTMQVVLCRWKTEVAPRSPDIGIAVGAILELRNLNLGHEASDHLAGVVVEVNSEEALLDRVRSHVMVSTLRDQFRALNGVLKATTSPASDHFEREVNGRGETYSSLP
jgi:hypothetical protein